MKELSSTWVTDRINELLEQRNWTVYRLAKESNLAYSSLNNLFKRANSPSIFTLSKICAGLNISLSDFFSDAPPACPEQAKLNNDERNVLALYNKLNRSDKALLVAYLSGLAKTEMTGPDDNA